MVWPWLVDEAIPAWVKKNYSPRESWKDKPFSKDDALFFFKGIEELSEIFTEERGRAITHYFNHPKFRSGYLLYFLPLQAAKFASVFQLHPGAMKAALDHGRKTGTLRVLDLGAGPGTASIAFLAWALDPRLSGSEELPPIEFHWCDTQAKIMEDGKQLVEMLASHFPRLRGKVRVVTTTAPWTRFASNFSQATSLVLLGHVINEASFAAQTGRDSDEQGLDPATLAISHLETRAEGGGILMIDPAARSSSQKLSRLRDQLLEAGKIENAPTAIWGPCLHAGRCPLAMGRDWCHFSIPAEIPGHYFKVFSKNLGSEKNWLKFSYLWLAAKSSPAPTPSQELRRVVSDVIDSSTVLLCEPEKVERLGVNALSGIHRGDVINLNERKSGLARSAPSGIVIRPRR